MTDQASSTTAPSVPAMPVIKTVTAADIREALVFGARDFLATPQFGLVIGGVVALHGIAIAAALFWLKMPVLFYPFAIGFPLVGPFLAVGLYEVSRRLEAGQPLNWSRIFSVIWAQRQRQLSWMAFVMLFIFWIWMYQIRLLVALFLGFKSFSSLDAFLRVVVTTPEGLAFLLVGHIVGAALALALFSITVVSIPLLLERENDFVTAIITSVSVVFKNPLPMLGWGMVVTLLVVVASVPFFLGLLVVMPVLGHGTWHLYRKAVEPLPPN